MYICFQVSVSDKNFNYFKGSISASFPNLLYILLRNRWYNQDKNQNLK